MVTPTKREVLKYGIEEEKNFLKGITKPLGDYYHQFLRAYGNPDRGLREAYTLLQYLEEIWPIFVEKRSEISVFFSYIQEEKKIISELTKYKGEAEQIIKGVIKRGRETLYPEEVSALAYIFPNLRIYVDYVAGRDNLTYKFLDGREIKEIIEEFRPTVESFERKIILNDNCSFYMGEPEKYSFLTLFVIDAYDNSLLRMILKAKSDDKIEEILKIYSPTKGLTEILFSVGDKIKEYNKKSLRDRKERLELCLPRNLARRPKLIDNGLKFSSYVEEIYGKNLFYTI
jgi:hypothetical protein